LLLSHPEVAYRSCEECKRWVYDPKSGKLEKQRKRNPDSGELELVPMPRKPGTKLPCWNCAKCPDDPKLKTPEEGRKAELSAKNWKAIRFYFQQKAVGGPVDELCRRNCGLIEWLLEEHRMLTGRMTMEMLRPR
jgi:hypothetical protein